MAIYLEQKSFESMIFEILIRAAKKVEGQTSPNPMVAAAIVYQNKILGFGVHQRAGTAHAELLALEDFKKNTKSKNLDYQSTLINSTLYLTLEPCCHRNKKTPPCTEKLLQSGVKKIVIGTIDPNIAVSGQGIEILKSNGIEVSLVSKFYQKKCDKLIRSFKKWCRDKKPWVVIKQAYRWNHETGLFTMLPDAASKNNTFNNQESLTIAHLERKKCDAIITSIPTILNDNPRFDVRLVEDFKDKKRTLGILSQKKRWNEIPKTWLDRAEKLNFKLVFESSIEGLLTVLAELGACKALVEAGPTLSESILNSNFWDEKLTIYHSDSHFFEKEDFITRRFRVN